MTQFPYNKAFYHWSLSSSPVFFNWRLNVVMYTLHDNMQAYDSLVAKSMVRNQKGYANGALATKIQNTHTVLAKRTWHIEGTTGISTFARVTCTELQWLGDLVTSNYSICILSAISKWRLSVVRLTITNITWHHHVKWWCQWKGNGVPQTRGDLMTTKWESEHDSGQIGCQQPS